MLFDIDLAFQIRTLSSHCENTVKSSISLCLKIQDILFFDNSSNFRLKVFLAISFQQFLVNLWWNRLLTIGSCFDTNPIISNNSMQKIFHASKWHLTRTSGCQIYTEEFIYLPHVWNLSLPHATATPVVTVPLVWHTFFATARAPLVWESFSPVYICLSNKVYYCKILTRILDKHVRFYYQ